MVTEASGAKDNENGMRNQIEANNCSIGKKKGLDG